MSAVLNDADERLCSPLSTTEMERRWSLARQGMRDLGVDALLVQGLNDFSVGGFFRWFTGQQASNVYPRTVLFPLDGPMIAVDNGPLGGSTVVDPTDPMNRGIGRRAFATSVSSVAYTGGYDAEVCAREITAAGFRRVGLVCGASMSHGFMAALQNAAGGVEWIDSTDMIERYKAIKSPEEIAFIRRTAVMQDQVFAKTCAFIRPGIKEHEVMAYAQYLGQLLGSEGGIFLGSTAPEGRAAMFRPRSQWGREIRQGDTFTLLIENSGPGGYYAELSRTFVLGKASSELIETHRQVVEARQHTVDRLLPGADCRAIFEAHNTYMRERGLPEERRLYGHSQGYDLAERPLLRQDETMALEANMLLAVHPTVANPRVFVTITDNYLLRAGGGPERLHATEERIFEL
ncbi:MAG: M24 family metallopeptidase [Burkholderiales bacterium]